MSSKLLTLLGFAQKAGKVVSGEEGLRWHAANGSAYLIILTEDAPEKKERDATFLAESHSIRLVRYGTKESISLAVGRTVSGVAALTDKNFAEAFLKYYDGREKK